MRLLLGGWQWPQPFKGATPCQYPWLLLVSGSSDTLLLVTTINCPHCALAISAQLRWTVVTSHQSDNCHVIITDHLVEIIKLSTDNRCQMIKRPQDVVKWRNEAVWRVESVTAIAISDVISIFSINTLSLVKYEKTMENLKNLHESRITHEIHSKYGLIKVERSYGLDSFNQGYVKIKQVSMNIKYEKMFFIFNL